ETSNIDAFFMQKRDVRVYKDGTFHLHNLIYEAPQAEKGGRTEIYFKPWDLSQIFYSANRIPARLLNKFENANRFENDTRKEIPRG
ncbi:MAG: Mu transposase C-terminal domain-containing protein, partial [Candidatus Riflebacteria bacterium]|nr:Mu transposase C-terminal domain-containing protein [Candidatus Riflebacteria bacterium]